MPASTILIVDDNRSERVLPQVAFANATQRKNGAKVGQVFAEQPQTRDLLEFHQGYRFGD